jgi:hypothetical protein
VVHVCFVESFFFVGRVYRLKHCEVPFRGVFHISRTEVFMAERKDEQGTGKHPHKSSEDPRPHHEAQYAKSEHSGKESSSERRSESESADLKSREYRDEHGNIHHHTRTAGKSNE